MRQGGKKDQYASVFLRLFLWILGLNLQDLLRSMKNPLTTEQLSKELPGTLSEDCPMGF